ncbi:hypothetical protein [Cupriavidus sp. 2SB]|uniref:hypothetical protein n=1 Tax=Cupriavidus sp. 2SB TaxID=2502199 RepID=UPI0010F509CA|nr:hypothetical protein [Cupriavidus sp. 2SB]
MIAKKIEDMPHEYALLMHPEQRRAALGDAQLKISNADIGMGGTDFYRKEWEGIHFYNCNFYGVIHLAILRNCVFEHCQFPGSNFQSLAVDNVLFLRTDTLGGAYLMSGASSQSKNVRFVECDFGGDDANPNRYGAISFHDVSYERCTGQYMVVKGHGVVIYRDCRFGPIYAANGSKTSRKIRRATTYIENCTFKGQTDIARSMLTSLTIRNSNFEVLEIGKSTVEGDVLIEDVQAGAMYGEFWTARSITIRNSNFRGINVNPKDWYHELYRALDCAVSKENLDKLQAVTVENVECGRDDLEEWWLAHQIDDEVTGCWILGGRATTVIRNCKIPKALLALQSANVLIDNYEGEKASFVSSKMGSLTFRATNITQAIDFTGVQVQKLDAKGLNRFTGQKIVLEGSNVSL